MSLLPRDRPTLLPAILDIKIEKELGEEALEEVVLVGVRGYRLNSMGKPKLNDRAIYDDALWVYSPRLCCFRRQHRSEFI